MAKKEISKDPLTYEEYEKLAKLTFVSIDSLQEMDLDPVAVRKNFKEQANANAVNSLNMGALYPSTLVGGMALSISGDSFVDGIVAGVAGLAGVFALAVKGATKETKAKEANKSMVKKQIEARKKIKNPNAPASDIKFLR